MYPNGKNKLKARKKIMQSSFETKTGAMKKTYVSNGIKEERDRKTFA
jgi:hypothetical protein